MAQNEPTGVPIVCENPQCKNLGCVVNIVSDIDDIDLFYAGYDGSSDADYCRFCGELGVAEDPVVLSADGQYTAEHCRL